MKPDVAPPPFAEEEEDEEEEVIREEKVVQITDDGTVDEKEAGKANIAPFVAIGATLVLSAIFGYLGGAQIDRAVRANKAIDAAIAIHDAIVSDQEEVKGLKSRISGAARKAMDPENPGPDTTLLNYLSKVKSERRFTATIWSGHFYQAFKARGLMFEYYRAIQQLWDSIDEIADRYADPTTLNKVKSWPERRQEILRINDVKGASGYGIAFISKGGKVFGRAGIFKNSRRETEKGKVVYQSEFVSLGGGSEVTLTEYQPGFPDLSDVASESFIRVPAETVVGQKGDVLQPGGPLISEDQDIYRQYLSDLNTLSGELTTVQGHQDNLIQALTEIRQARRPFTFGF